MARPVEDDLVDEAIAESFPASDPPSWTLGRLSAPVPPVGAWPRPAPPAVRAATVPRRIGSLEQRRPRDGFMWAGAVAMALAAGLLAVRRSRGALVVAQIGANLMLIALCDRLAGIGRTPSVAAAGIR